MIDAVLNGPRIAELVIAEIGGRDLGPLESLGIEGVEQPTRHHCEVGDTYTVARDGTPVARFVVEEDALVVTVDDSRFAIVSALAVKPGIDELTGRLDG